MSNHKKFIDSLGGFLTGKTVRFEIDNTGTGLYAYVDIENLCISDTQLNEDSLTVTWGEYCGDHPFTIPYGSIDEITSDESLDSIELDYGSFCIVVNCKGIHDWMNES